MRLLIKLFPVCRRRVSCWSFALAMAFCFGFLLMMMERASLGAGRGTLWVMSLSSACDGGRDEDETIV